MRKTYFLLIQHNLEFAILSWQYLSSSGSITCFSWRFKDLSILRCNRPWLKTNGIQYVFWCYDVLTIKEKGKLCLPSLGNCTVLVIILFLLLLVTIQFRQLYCYYFLDILARRWFDVFFFKIDCLINLNFEDIQSQNSTFLLVKYVGYRRTATK